MRVLYRIVGMCLVILGGIAVSASIVVIVGEVGAGECRQTSLIADAIANAIVWLMFLAFGAFLGIKPRRRQGKRVRKVRKEGRGSMNSSTRNSMMSIAK